MLAAPTPFNEDERLASLRRMLLLSTPDEETFDRVVRITKRVFGVPVVLVSLIDENRQWFKACYGLAVRETGRDVSFCGHAIMSDDLFIVEDATDDARFSDNPLVIGPPHVIFYAGRPLKNNEGFNVGTLCIIDHQARHLNDDEKRALDDLGNWVEQVFLTRQLSESQMAVLTELDQVKRNSALDPMLNIWHKGAELEMLKREIARAFRNKSNLSVMMIDVDKFKQVNDEYGHLAGDALLIEFVHRIRCYLRSYDSLGRYGGDEFMVILPDIGQADVRKKAAAILEHIVCAPFVFENHLIEVSASIGTCTVSYAEITPDESQLIGWADSALLQAKRNGRARVESTLHN